MNTRNEGNPQSLLNLQIGISILIGYLLLKIYQELAFDCFLELHLNIYAIEALLFFPLTVLFIAHRFYSAKQGTLLAISTFILLSIFLRKHELPLMISGILFSIHIYFFLKMILEQHCKQLIIKEWDKTLLLLIVSLSILVHNTFQFLQSIYFMYLYIGGVFVLFLRSANLNKGLSHFQSNTVELKARHTFSKLFFHSFYTLYHLHKSSLYIIRLLILTLFFIQSAIHFNYNLHSVLNFALIILGCIILLVSLGRYFLYNAIIDKYGKLIILLITGIMICIFGISSLSIHYFFTDQHRPFMGVPSLQMVLTVLLTVMYFTNVLLFEEDLSNELLETISINLRVDYKLYHLILVSTFSVGIFYFVVGNFWYLDEYNELIYIPLLIGGVLYLINFFFLQKSYHKMLYKNDKSITNNQLKFYPVLKIFERLDLAKTTVTDINLLIDLAPFSLYRKLNEFLYAHDYKVQYLVLDLIIKNGRIELIEEVKKLSRNKKAYLHPNYRKFQEADKQLHHIKERLLNTKYVDQLSNSKLSDERILGAQLSRYLHLEEAEKLLIKLLDDQFIEVRISAIDTCINLDVNKDIELKVINQFKMASMNNVLIDALLLSKKNHWNRLKLIFTAIDFPKGSKIQVIRLMGLYNSEESTKILRTVTRNTDKKLSDTAIDILSQLPKGNYDKKFFIEDHLVELSRQIVWNYMSIDELQVFKNEYYDLIQSIKKDNTTLLEKVIDYCSLIYDYEDIQKIKKTLKQNNDFGIQLIDTLIPNTLLIKPLLLLFFKEEEHTMKDLYQHWPIEREPIDDIFLKILLNERRFVSNWTRYCVIEKVNIYKTHKLKDAMITLFQSQELILQEIALFGLYNQLEEKEFKSLCTRSGVRLASKRIEKIKLLKSLSVHPVFNKLDKDCLFQLYEKFMLKETLEDVYDYRELPFIYILEGSLSVDINSYDGIRTINFSSEEYLFKYNYCVHSGSIVSIKGNGKFGFITADIFKALVGQSPQLYSFCYENLNLGMETKLVL